MKLKNLIVVFVVACAAGLPANGEETNRKPPTILTAILARNKAHTLPYFLSFFERLDYPKNRVHLWIRSDNNVDNTIEILEEWLSTVGKYYHGVNASFDEESKGFADEEGVADWSQQRFLHVINLREEALKFGKSIWADYVWMLDADAFLANPNTLKDLTSKNVSVVAPMLKSDGMYSNFWAGITADYYYLRTERYEPILFREETGCFDVPMVNSAVLIDLRVTSSDSLTYDSKKLSRYDGPTDDIITFAISAKQAGIPLFVCNDNLYGFIMVPLESEESLADDFQRLTNIKSEILAHDNYLPLSENLEKYVNYPKMDTLNLDHIYMINLLRRPERRKRMHRLFKELGLEAETVNAADGRALDEPTLQKLGIEMMEEYADPYHKRPMTTGEIGCFLSHYAIWKKVMTDGHKIVMVLEDDVRFEPFFRQKVNYILRELESYKIDWDLVYLGRKRLIDKEEPWVEGSKYLVKAGYSYWTIGYILSASGAKKLVEALPLEKLVPVDEYLPILSNAHPRMEWKARFPKRDLVVLSTNPLLIHPTHYTGETGYVSDTENSTIIYDNENPKETKREEL